MTKQWHAFRRLSGFERGVVLEAACGLASAWLGLRLLGFRRWKNVLAFFAPSVSVTARVPQASYQHSAETIARMEAAAAHHLFFNTNCLEQSLVLWWLLRRRGVESELRIGARKEANRFEAHAWVELDSVVLNDATGEHRHFVPFEGSITPLETQTD